MKIKLTIAAILISLSIFGQTDLLPTVAWRTYVRNVEMLTDSTYKFDVMPLDWNEAGASVLDYGNFFVDYGGNIYEVVDSASLSVTVWDVFESGVSPQVGRIGVMYNSAFIDYLTPVNYTYMDKSAMDQVRAIELHKIGQMLKMHGDSMQVLSDTLTWDATRYDIDTLHQKTIDSLLIHRTEIDELKNSSIELDFATVQEALIGNDSTKIMTPRTNRDSDTLLYVPFHGAAEDVYSDHNATFDTLRSQAMEGDNVRLVFVNNEGTLFDSLIHVGNSDIVLNLADIFNAQIGLNDNLMTALRTAEQLTLNAVPYYNVKEDIYSNFDATFDSIFASNLYQETISTSITGMGGVYDKEVSTNNIEVYLNGVLQRENVNYTQTETQISFIKAPLATDYITIKYK